MKKKEYLKKFFLCWESVFLFIFMIGIFGPSEVFFGNYTELGVRLVIFCGWIYHFHHNCIRFGIFPRNNSEDYISSCLGIIHCRIYSGYVFK